MNAKEISALLSQAMPVVDEIGLDILCADDGFASIRLPVMPWMLRPGNTLSGPCMFTAADTASYVLILAACGPKLLAVTTSSNINFLSKPIAQPLIADARFLKQGNTLVVTDVLMYNEIDGLKQAQPVAQMTCTYAIPKQ